MNKTIHVIGSPNQNKQGSPIVDTEIYENDDGDVIEKNNIIKIFVHFAELNSNNELIPHFITNEEQFIFRASNEILAQKINTGKIRHKYISASHLEISIKSSEINKFLNEVPDFTVADVGRFVRQLYPTGNIKRRKIINFHDYLCDVMKNNKEVFDLYKIYSLMDRLGIHVEIDINMDSKQIIDIRSRGPLLINQYNPYKWTNIPWGEKKRKRLGNPVIQQELLHKFG